MKILVLTSRYTAGRDIISEDFGRQVRLFEALAKYGHEISFFCADYKKFEKKNTELHGIDVRIRPFSIKHIRSFILEFKKTLKSEKWGFVISSSDPLWGVICHRYAKKYKIKFVYDLQDNYEVYASYKFPFFPVLEKRTIQKADIITTVSHALKEKIKPIRKNDVYVIQNGVDVENFKPMGMKYCRKELKLPLNKKIVLYTGSLQRRQGIGVLLEAFKKIKKIENGSMLVIAGRFVENEEKFFDFNQQGVDYLGSLSQDKIVKLINSADITVVPNIVDDFTKYCFPYKILEYAACQRPIVCTDVGDATKIVKDCKGSICQTNDPEDMADKILLKLRENKKKVNYKLSRNTWDYTAGLLDNVIKKYSKEESK